MRGVSVTDIRGPARGWVRGCLFALLALACLGTREASAQAIARYVRDTGNINFVTTGGSMRTQPNTGNACLVGTTSAQALSGIPAGTTIRNAYLYWGASGTTSDPTVTFNGNTITATRNFNTTVPFNSSNHAYFGHMANVTSIVSTTRNGTYTFGGLTVNVGNPWCNNGLVTGGWALIVIYEGASERLRAINIFDGMDYFYGSSLTTLPNGFRVPNSNIDGRIGVFTLDGDPGNSNTLNGFSEAMRYNGTLLDDGINVAGSDPLVQQFDGTINTQGVATSYGIDVDQYDISSLLTPGQTSGTVLYSAGGDVVVLMAQVVSATSDPGVDLSITKTHTGTFVSGGTGTYAITVSNRVGMEREDNTVTVTDTLPAGLTYNSFSGTGWSCSAAGQVVTCTHPPTLDAGQSFPVLNLTVNVLESAAANVNNTAVVSSASVDFDPDNNSVTDATATIDPTLTTSTKTVVDLNGGEASPGDTLRYTITLRETAGGQAVNVSLTDDIPANTTFAGFVTLPAGATSSFTGPTAGANARGVFTVSGITVPASSSSTVVVFDVTVIAGTMPGATIDNTANVTNPNGPENDPAAPQVVVNPSLIPSSGTKFLYLHQVGTTHSLGRTVPLTTENDEVISAGETDTWAQAIPLRTAFSIASGSFNVRLWLSRSGGGTGSSRNFTVTVSNSNGWSSAVTSSVTIGSTTAPSEETFIIPNATAQTFPVGSTFTITVRNNSGNAVTLWHDGDSATGNNSRIEFTATTVVNVDSVATYNATFNGGAIQTTYYPNAIVYVRAQVSDPFGSFDIGSARITILDPTGATIVNSVAMTAQGAPATCNSTTAATCVYQYAYTVPNITSGTSPQLGGWTARVVASEGTEGTVTDTGVTGFTVAIPQPSITMLKTSTVLSDPFNNTTNPKRIPNAVVRYDITLTNSGPGTVDSGTLVITDPVPANSSLYVSTTSGNPVVFINGATASGLTYNYATNVTYSSVGDTGPWTYTPVPDVNGFDAAVRAVRIAPTGVMSAAGTGSPAFTIQFRVRIN